VWAFININSWTSTIIIKEVLVRQSRPFGRCSSSSCNFKSTTLW